MNGKTLGSSELLRVPSWKVVALASSLACVSDLCTPAAAIMHLWASPKSATTAASEEQTSPISVNAGVLHE